MIKTERGSNHTLNSTGHAMREVSKSTLPGGVLDKAKCRKSVDEALKSSEPLEAFDRRAWLTKTKEQLKRHASASQ